MSFLGGVTWVFEPLAFANNPQMGGKYDPSKPKNTILYTDACNLYGYAMRLPLPISDFMWVEVSSIGDWADFILKQGDEQEIGYILEVDLEYPEELHDLLDTYPCAPERFNIEEKHLSEYQKKLGKEC